MRRVVALTVLPLMVLSAGCGDRDVAGLDISRATIDPVVFDDDYGPDVYFQPFFQTHVGAATVDETHAVGGFAFDGARSLKIEVPPAGSSLGIFAGGVLTSSGSRDLADFNALTFYARADANVSMDVVGFGNDNTGTSRYEAGRGGIPLTTEWAFHIVPIPNATKLISERGLFTFAEGAETPGGYDVYFDDIRFAELDDISVFRPNLPVTNRGYFLGMNVLVEGTNTIFLVDGGFMIVNHSPYYLDYSSSNPAVANVTPSGRVQVVGEGQAIVTAMLGDVEAFGQLNVTGHVPPTSSAPAPALPASDVISMFSDAYDDVSIDTWRTNWSRAQVEDFVVAGDNAKLYSALSFVGIEFLNSPIDASDMEYLHVDVYAPTGTNFRFKVVSFPVGQTSGVETPELILDAGTTPAFTSGGWASLDIPLSAFQLPGGFDWSSIGQLVFATSNAQLALVDNVYWHK